MGGSEHIVHCAQALPGLEAESKVGMMCPLCGKHCPGEAHCGPALHSARYRNADKDETHRPTAPVCPVARLVDIVDAMMMLVYPVLLGKAEEAGEQLDGTDDMTSMERKLRELKRLGIKLDQEGL